MTNRQVCTKECQMALEKLQCKRLLLRFVFICYSDVTLQTSDALALPLWGSCTSGTAVEGVVNEDVAVHAE